MSGTSDVGVEAGAGAPASFPRALPWAMLSILHALDEEAVPRADGKPTGLNWYGGHARPDLARPQTEPLWSKALASGLSAGGYASQAEVPYPSTPRERCDLVVGNRIWIEVKGAWKAYWGKRDHLYRSYLLHPLVAGLDPKSHTAALDIVKLTRLTKVDADYVGLLLIGFERQDNPMDAEVDVLVKGAGLGAWSRTEAGWPDAHRAGERVRCSLWVKRVA